MNTSKEYISLNKNVLNPSLYDITKFTLLDYPEKVACIFWFAGCNMRCLYCYNTDIVLGKGKISEEEALLFLSKRKGLLDAVVLSGGECTAYNNIVSLSEKIKGLGFKIKVDTNGTHPEILDQLIQQKLLDYLALDYKAPESKFFQITRNRHYEKFKKSLRLLINSKIPFEVRTTFHSSLMDLQDLTEIVRDLEKEGFKGHYFIQNYRHNNNTLGKINDQNHLLKIDLETKSFNIDYRNF